MKSTVNEKTSEQAEYPCLMVSDCGLVWFMTGKGKGVRVSYSQDDGDEIGFYNRALNMSDFEPFHGTVTLEN